VWRHGRPVVLGAAKQRALLGLLLIRRGEVGRDVLVDALWGERPPKGARNTLQVYVSSLRKALGREVIETTSGGYRLRLEAGAVDAEQFESLFAEGRTALAAGDSARGCDLLATALGLWRGPALVDLRYEAFAQAEAGRLDELRTACLEERVEAELRLGRHAGVVPELEALVVEHPLRERLRAQLILALYRSGRQSEALAQYQAARRMLANELGLEPGPELRELERLILAHDPMLAAPTGPHDPPSNLPLQPTPFIGRERELAELVELIRSKRRRLITLTGAGGTGKTRLAIEAVTQLEDDYPDGVWWVPLQLLMEPGLVAATVGGALEARGDVASHVGDRRVLLLLDNFEQLLEAANDTAALLASCPNLMLLVTSREPLRVAAEREYRVPPMTETDAVTLFGERALDGAAEGVVTEICQRLDCLPLAVELAAARTRSLSPEQILVRLEEALPLLADGPRDVPVRQQTLRATIEWSYDLLTSAEKVLFSRLSVFAGGWDIAAAVAVCCADELSGLAVHDGICSLIEKSLVERVVGAADEPRYSMLQTIREYAADALRAGGERETLRRRHAEYFLEVAERAERTRVAGEIAAADDSDIGFADEVPNLREALSFAFDSGDLELALRLAGAGGTAWTLTGATHEGEAWLRRVLDATEHLQTPARARVFVKLGGLEHMLGNVKDAEKLYEEAGRLCERLGDMRGLLQALIGRVELLEMTSDLELMRGRIAAARALADEVGTDFDRARILFAAADVESRAGNHEAAAAMFEEGIGLVRNLGVPRRAWSWHLVNLGWITMQGGDLERAKALFEEYLAETSVKYPIGVGIARGNLGLVALYERDGVAAASHFRQALALARAPRPKLLIAEVLHGLAAVATLEGDLERAARLWGAADVLKRATSAPRTEPEEFIVETYLEPARAELGRDLHETARVEGAGMTLDEAIVYALVGPD